VIFGRVGDFPGLARKNAIEFRADNHFLPWAKPVENGGNPLAWHSDYNVEVVEVFSGGVKLFFKYPLDAVLILLA